MKIKRICFILMVLFITIGILPNVGNAAETTFHLNLNIDGTTYAKGDTVSVKINLANVSDTSGIAGYQGKLEYDSNVLTFDSITSENWEVMENEGRNCC